MKRYEEGKETKRNEEGKKAKKGEERKKKGRKYLFYHINQSVINYINQFKNRFQYIFTQFHGNNIQDSESI